MRAFQVLLKTAFEAARAKFNAAGYELPTLVFWQMGRATNAPVKANTSGAVIVSGLSPATMKQVFGKVPTPLDLVFKIADQERYKLSSY